MVALVPFTLELASVRAAAATAREVLEARNRVLEGELEGARRRIAELEAAPAFSPDELPTGPVRLSPPPAAVEKGEVIPSNEGAKPAPAPVARLATEAERLAPPRNPRLTGLSTLEGMTFGTWLVLGRGASAGSGASYWKCRCVKCGATRELAAVGAFSLRRKPPWCSACRSKGKAAPKAEEHDDQEDEE
jgi:hypothetical protein